MKRVVIGLLLSLVVTGAFGQAITTEHGQKSDEIFLKLRKIDMLDQLLPLLLTKQQIEDILPVVEKARAKQKQVLEAEDAELAKLDPEISDVLDKAINKKQYPSHDFLDRIAAKTKEMAIKRQLALSQMLADLNKAVDSILTDGQKKTMENSFDAKFIDPSKKPEDLTPEMKRGFFLERIFLDPLCRELLIAIEDKS